MSSQSSENRVQWVYSSRDNQELAERYDQWSKDYETDLSQDFVYLAPQRTAEVFANHVPKDARILDAGAGTGLVGVHLADMGYSQMVAMDLSQVCWTRPGISRYTRTFTRWSWARPWATKPIPLTRLSRLES